VQQLTQSLFARGSDLVRATNPAYGALYGMVDRQAAMLAYIDIFWLVGVVILAMVPLCI
jgi:DHA2 family multidrug resistance protein